MEVNPQKKPRFGTSNKKQSFSSLSTEQLVAKREELLKKKADLEQDINLLLSKGVDTNLESEMQALHAYNDVKDLTQSVIGCLAEIEQVTVSELHKELKLPLD